MSKQNGYTLIELIMVIGLVSGMTLLSMLERSRNMEIDQARITGGVLFEYNNAVRGWLSNNIGSVNFSQSGTAWLKSTTCPGGLSTVAYLPCDFESASNSNPIKFGRLVISSNITTTGSTPNKVTTVTTTTSPFKLSNGDLRSDLAGVAAMVAAAGSIRNLTPVMMATDGKFGSDPETGVITIIASNNGADDAWLRTDGSNTMNANLTFSQNKPEDLRQIKNVSRLQSLISEALYLGQDGGAINAQNVVVDANQKILGKLLVTNVLGSPTAIDAESGDIVTRNGDIRASKNIIAGGSITSEQNISARDDVIAGRDMYAQRYYDSDDALFFLDPNKVSELNSLHTASRIKTDEFLDIGGIVTEGVSCDSAGLIAKDTSGGFMSCISGFWKSVGGVRVILADKGAGGGTYSYSSERPTLVNAGGTARKTGNDAAAYVTVDGSICSYDRGTETPVYSSHVYYAAASCSQYVQPGLHTVAIAGNYASYITVIEL